MLQIVNQTIFEKDANFTIYDQYINNLFGRLKLDNAT